MTASFFDLFDKNMTFLRYHWACGVSSPNSTLLEKWVFNLLDVIRRMQ